MTRESHLLLVITRPRSPVEFSEVSTTGRDSGLKHSDKLPCYSPMASHDRYCLPMTSVRLPPAALTTQPGFVSTAGSLGPLDGSVVSSGILCPLEREAQEKAHWEVQTGRPGLLPHKVLQSFCRGLVHLPSTSHPMLQRYGLPTPRADTSSCPRVPILIAEIGTDSFLGMMHLDNLTYTRAKAVRFLLLSYRKWSLRTNASLAGELRIPILGPTAFLLPLSLCLSMEQSNRAPTVEKTGRRNQ